MRDSMTFYAEWLTAIKALPKSTQADILLAILEYGFEGVDTCPEGSIESVVLAFVKPQIDLNNQRYENGCKGGEFGKLGGRPRKTPEKPQENPKITPRKPQENPTGFSTPFSPYSPSPAPPTPIPPLSPTTTTTTPAHTREEDFSDLEGAMVEDGGIDAQSPKEKSCAKKESPQGEALPDGTYIPTEQLADTLLADTRWIRNVAANRGHPIEEVRSLVQEFCTNILLTEDVKEFHDAKRHFIAWLRKKPNNDEKQRTTRAYGNPEPDFEGIKAFVARGIASAKPPQ